MTIVNYLLAIPKCEYFLQLDIDQGKLHGVSFQAIKKQKNMSTTKYPGMMAKQLIADENEKIISQFKQYLISPAINWDVTFVWPGMSDFQLSVLDYLKKIPIGTTKTYGQVATDLQTSARAVGNACRRNPFPIIYPCHRVVAQNGLGGYDGEFRASKNNNKAVIDGRLAIKYFLLQHEQAVIN
ncbi:MAG: MGMT family protein [Pseudomonadota bacterium]